MIVVLVVRYGMVRPKQQRRSIRLFPCFSLPALHYFGYLPEFWFETSFTQVFEAG
jgi:hypothetical protein